MAWGGAFACLKAGCAQAPSAIEKVLSLEAKGLSGKISRFGTLVGMTKYLARHIVRFALLMLAVGLVVLRW